MRKFQVEIEVEGKKYNAFAAVKNGMLTVKSIPFGSKTASESSDNLILARILLHELVNNPKKGSDPIKNNHIDVLCLSAYGTILFLGIKSCERPLISMNNY